MRQHRQIVTALVLSLLGSTQAAEGQGQYPPGEHASRNIKVLSHLPLVGPRFSHADIEVEQELSRPYAYVAHRHGDVGFYILSIKEPTNPEVLYKWTIENPELHQGSGLDNKYVKVGGRYYDVTSFQFRQGGPDADLGAVVVDVTGLPDPSTVKEVARIRAPEIPGGFHNIFAYKHSDGRALLFATTNGEFTYIYDVALVVSGGRNGGLVSKIAVPQPSERRARQWHDFYVGYDPASRQDRFYGGGSGGYYVFDVTDVTDSKLLATVTGAAGVKDGHTFTPTPDGRYALSMSEPTYQYAPMRIFDLKPALDGEVKSVSRPIGAWMAKWNGASHNHEIRWPYAFISAQDDGLQVLNLMDPTNPYTVAYYNTREGPELFGEDLGGRTGTGGGIYNGAWGVDIRNADGLIVVGDFNSGLWVLKMDGFDGWNGHNWGMPNNSSAQDWDNGPDGAPRAPKAALR